MASKPVIRSKTELDPMFFIPEGVEELVYNDEFETTEPSEEEVEVSYSDYSDEYDVEDDNNYYEGPATPEIIGVVSQTIRRLPSGQQVVDVVIEVSDVAGAENYEVRVTKV